MLVKYILPLLSLCGLAFAIHTAANSSQQAAVAKPVAEPARAPFAATIAGAGIVEARSRNIAIGAQVGGVVARVGVDVGSRVKAGDLLFSVDDRKERAALQVAESAVAVARAELARLDAQPRAEDLPPWRAAVAVAEAQLAEARARIRAADERRAKGSPPPTAKGEASVRAQLVQADMATVAGLWRSMFGQEVTIAERVKSRIISMEIQATPREEIRSKFVAGLRERGIFVLEKADRVVFDLEPPPSPQQ